MAGRQRSLGLIPATLVRSTGSKPPMTSKAAKKAYQQANRVPRMSRAEQRRQEAEEIRRLNEEYEKERAATKAKMVREKKVEKAKAEKEARRKIGQPEPSRHVRPSQPMISLFVINGNKRAWKEMDGVVEDSTDSREGDMMGERELLKQRLRKEVDSDDEFGEFPSLSQTNILETITSSILSTRKDPSISPPQNRLVLDFDVREALKIPDWRHHEAKGSCYEDDDDFDDLPSTQLFTEVVAEALSKPAVAKQIRLDVLSTSTTTNQPKDNLEFDNPVGVMSEGSPARQKPDESQIRPRIALGELPINMLPPPPPPKPKRPLTFVRSPPKYLPPSRKSCQNMRSYASMQPSSTQMFIEDNLEDFFPSPTQELRELHDRPQSVLSTKIYSTRENAGWINQQENVKKGREDPFLNLICTQDLAMSSQDLLEITTPSQARPAIPSKPRLIPALATDIRLSPAPVAPTHRAREPMAPPSLPAPRAKRPFFEEKEEDLLSAALHESKVLAANRSMFEGYEEEIHYQQAESRVAGGEQNTRRPYQRIQSTATDYGDEEFCGCSQELLALC